MRSARLAGLAGLVGLVGIGVVSFALPAAAVSYSAGQACPLSLHGQTTVDANGQPLVCENQGGTWKWEPASASSATTTAPTVVSTTQSAVTTTVPVTTTSVAPTTTQAPMASTSPDTGSTGGSLPTTGSGWPTMALAAIGAGLLLVSGALFGGLSFRRRLAVHRAGRE